MIWVHLLFAILAAEQCSAAVNFTLPNSKLSVNFTLPNLKLLKTELISRFQEHFKNVDADRMFRLKEKLAAAAAKEITVEQKSRSIEPLLKGDPDTEVDESSLSYINDKAGISDLLFEGDVIYSDKQMELIEQALEESDSNRTKRQAINPVNYWYALWPNRVVYYELSSGLTERIKKSFGVAVKDWEANTCLTFKEDKLAANRIFVFPETGCWSQIGMAGGVQGLSLAAGCDRVAKHELGHAIGMHHSQSRHDRDSFLTVNLQNVRDNMQGNFYKASPATNENFGIGYDYGSVMQYYPNLWMKSATGPYPLQPKDKFFLHTMGNDKGSFNDILMINKLYKCEEVCAKQANVVKCTNGGIPNPKACARCICPRGYSGVTCADPQKDKCGTTIMSTRYATVLKKTVGAAAPAYQYYAKECTIHLKAPPGKKIEVQIKSMSPAKCSFGCRPMGIELKARRQPQFRGILACCPADNGKKFVSENQFFPIIFYSVAGVVNYEITYRWVEPTTPSTTTYKVY